ncbi:hypothetical protein LT493_32060 [Streptomyces tricolor]|nr:hypothetical protein [Streptomyces tricolor]
MRNLVTTALALLLVATATAGGLAYQQRREALREAQASAARSIVQQGRAAARQRPAAGPATGRRRRPPARPGQPGPPGPASTRPHHLAVRGTSLDGFGGRTDGGGPLPGRAHPRAATADGRLRFWDVTRARAAEAAQEGLGPRHVPARGRPGAPSPHWPGGPAGVPGQPWRPREMTLWDTSDRAHPSPGRASPDSGHPSWRWRGRPTGPGWPWPRCTSRCSST